jgi:hypothetical protein
MIAMSERRNYTDDALETFAQDLDAGEQKMLVLAGALPAYFRDFNPNLRGSDVARMIEFIEEQ